MLMTLVTWIYAWITIGLLGFGTAALVEQLFHYRIKAYDSILVGGMIAATVYAQIFSLFGRVNIEANVVLIMLCAAIFVLQRKKILAACSAWRSEKKTAYKAVVCLLILLWAYCTSRGYIHYDSDLYHAQSIRWLEEYGIVPGLGNLHERFAYNSSFFALSALYSLKFVLGDSMHTMNGFMALLLSITCLPIAKSWKKKAFSVADFARVGAIYYLTTITNEVVSPASDYAVMCVIFFVVIKWLDLLEEKNAEIAPYALLCVAGVYALSIKVTAGLVLLLVIKPAYMLIREKRVKEIFCYLAAGLLVAVPWMIRTVIISGWLFYPLTAIDLFNVDWKMDAVYVDVDAAQIKAWGRALYAIGLLDVPITGWFPNWFTTTLSGMEKLLVIASVTACAAVVVTVLLVLFRKQWAQMDILLVMITLMSSYLFWQTSAPLIRYGYAYILLLVCVVFGFFLTALQKPGQQRHVGKTISAGIYVLLCAYGLYKGVILGTYIYHTSFAGYYIWQEDYGTYEVDSYEVNGVTFYYPIEGDRIGYDYFPASCGMVDLEFRGETIQDGFRKVQD